MLLEFKAHELVASAAMMSHKDVDYDKAVAVKRGLYHALVNTVDYVGMGKTYKDVLAAERQEFVDMYLNLRKKSVRAAQEPDKGDGIEIVKVGAVNG